MILHEAVKKARKDLGLSQKKLADMAGLQRRQLATLESGGNVTLATVRKIMAQLPNLESFTIDSARVTHTPGRAMALAEEAQLETLNMYAAIIARIAARIRAGIPPGDLEVESLTMAQKMFELMIRFPAVAVDEEIRTELQGEPFADLGELMEKLRTATKELMPRK